MFEMYEHEVTINELQELLKDMERERASLRKSLNEAKDELLAACSAMLQASEDSWHWEHRYHQCYADYRAANERYRKLLKQMAAKNKMIVKIREEIRNEH